MITRWRLRNFKAIANQQDVRLGDLTVLAGANSSGKSTLIQSILLLTQTLESDAQGEPLVLNGDKVSLGTPNDIWHAGAEDEPLEIDLEISPLRRGNVYVQRSLVDQTIRITLNFLLTDERTRQQTSQELILNQARYEVGHRGRLPDDKLWWEISYSSARRSRATPVYLLRRLSKLAQREWAQLARVPYRSPEISTPDGLEVLCNHFLPNQISAYLSDQQSAQLAEVREYLEIVRNIDLSASPKQSQRIPAHIARAVNRMQNDRRLARRRIRFEGVYLSDFYFFVRELDKSERQILVDILDEHSRELGRSSGERQSGFGPYPGTLNDVRLYVLNLFRQRVRYISAYRQAPRVLYGLETRGQKSQVGSHGEGLAFSLHNMKTLDVQCWNPERQQVEGRTLYDALIYWLKYLDIMDDIDTKSMGKIGRSISVRSSGVKKELDLTSVGFGVSQVLPILVEGLAAPAGSLLLVEQPEVHLHPRVQSRLADFFIGIARTDKQVIVETHSDHLVNRIFTRIAESPTGEGNLRNVIQMYFVQREAGKAQIQPIDVDELGTLADWPSGFFDESLHEADAHARARHLKQFGGEE